VKYMFAGMGDS